jgi:lysozyme
VEQEVKLSKAAAAMMHKYEGYRNRPYLCPAHMWTIGYGHVLYQEQIRLPMARVDKSVPMIREEMPLRPEDNRVWAKQETDDLFDADIASFERGVLRLVPGVVGHQGRFDALVSFAYNVGLGNLQRSTVRIKANRGEWEAAADALLLWNKAGGKVFAGLDRRRREERAFFLS